MSARACSVYVLSAVHCKCIDNDFCSKVALHCLSAVVPIPDKKKKNIIPLIARQAALISLLRTVECSLRRSLRTVERSLKHYLYLLTVSVLNFPKPST